MSAITRVPVRPRVADRITSLIGGDRVPAHPAASDFPVINPATEEQISVLQQADAAEVDAAVRAAREAFDRGPWPRLALDDRKDILYAIRDRMRAQREELAYFECLNAGLPIARIREQIGRAARNFEFFAEVASTMSGETYTGNKGFLTYVTREPKGVAALIAPWNA
ncbi:MAG: aldehyde dehydrogenase family protein, partial [Steroidobacteraceae bacterium]